MTFLVPNAADQRTALANNRTPSGSITLDPATVEAVIAQAVGVASDRELAELTALSPITIRRIRTGLPVLPRVVRKFSLALDRARRSPSMTALLGSAEQAR